MTTTLPPRNEVPVDQTWDLSSIFPTPAGWEAACQQLVAALPSISAYQGKLGTSPQTLLEFINLFQETATLMGKIGVYANNAYAVDTLDQALAARAGQARGLMARFGAAASFLDPELMGIGFPTLRQWLQDEPGLAFFAFYLDKLELRQAHVRSGEVEQTLALAGDPFSAASSIYNALNNADLTFQPAVASDGSTLEVGQASIGGLVTHPDRAVRRSAWENYSDGYLQFKNTMAATLTATLKQDVYHARVRGYEFLAARLAGAQQHPARGVPQPDRDLQEEPADLAPLLALAPAPAGLRPAARLRHQGPHHPGQARGALPARPSTGSARAWPRWATTTSASCGVAAWKIAGSTGRATRASARAPSPAAPRAPCPSS